jgi:hypothetical protein
MGLMKKRIQKRAAIQTNYFPAANRFQGYNGPWEIKIILIQIAPFLNGVKSVFFVEKSTTFPFPVHKGKLNLML